MFDMTPIAEAVIALVLALITAFVIPYIRSKTTLSQQAKLQSLVTIAVKAAEQIFTGTGLGEKKKPMCCSGSRIAALRSIWISWMP